MSTLTTPARREAHRESWEDDGFDVIGGCHLDTDLIGGANLPDDVVGGACSATDLMGGASLDLDLIGGASMDSDVISGIELRRPALAAGAPASHEVAGGHVVVDPLRAGHEAEERAAKAESSSIV